MKKNILIIDDEKSICTSLSFALEDYYKVFATTEPSQGLNIIEKEEISLVLLDLRIGKVSGLDVLKDIKNKGGNIVVIIMTAYGSIKSTITAIKNGAFTYLTKPLDIDELLVTIEKGLEYKALNEKVEYLSNELKDKYSSKTIVAQSPAMEEIHKLIYAVKDVETNVLVVGESGTGKELVARAIHYDGRRSKENFVEINCAAIPDGLLESELFGHKKGAFTGADRDKMGKFQYAGKGTILLDEIADMSLNLQTKLLRVLEQREFTPVGSNEKINLHARIIASTNKDLKKLMLEDKFRSDLYFRLNVIEINLPPLRERKEDVPLLCAHFINLYNEKLNKNVDRLSPNAENILLNYSYPGNIRELSNIIERGVLLAAANIINVDNLPDEIKTHELESMIQKDMDCLVGLSLKEIEKRVIKASLELNNGHRKNTAEMLGISERGLRNKINRYGF